MALPASYRKMPLRAQCDRLAFGLFGGSDGVGAGVGFGGGTSTDPLEWDTSANWIDFRTKGTVAAGSSRLAYLRHTISGAGSDGETLRAYTFIENTVTGSVHGIHATCQVGTSGQVTGAAGAVRATYAVSAQTKELSGSAGCLVLDASIGAGITFASGTRHALVRAIKSGSVDIPYFMSIEDDGCLKGNGSLNAITTGDALKVIGPTGQEWFIPLVTKSA